jgi:hypothetical protein
MKVNVTCILRDIEGLALIDPEVKDAMGATLRPARDFTLRKACIDALLQADAPSGEEKLTRFKLAMRIQHDNEPDLSQEEIVKIKQCIGLTYGGIVVGRAYEILDPTPSRATAA